MRKKFLRFVVFISKLASKVYIPTYVKKSTKQRYNTLTRVQIGIQTGEFSNGDIIFTRTRGWLSNLFLGKWTHAGMICSADQVIEAVTEGGVKKTPLTLFIMGKDNILIKRCTKPYSRLQVVERAERVLGAGYDWSFSNPDKIYCSELIRVAYGMPKWLPTIKRFGSDTLSPMDLEENKNFKKILEV